MPSGAGLDPPELESSVDARDEQRQYDIVDGFLGVDIITITVTDKTEAATITVTYTIQPTQVFPCVPTPAVLC